jgi:S-adenosylmethionine-diacylgycerolhomoserine-N-methlytransferase
MPLTLEPRWLDNDAMPSLRPGAGRETRPEKDRTHLVGACDDSRKRLLHGREELFERLPFRDGDVWIDFGGGAGANLELLGKRIRSLRTVYLVEQAPALLQAAEERIARHGWTNVVAIAEDAAELPLRLENANVVTFCYSLTRIADWYTALENAWRWLHPNGHIGVVDFYVSRKYPKPGFVRHDDRTRCFWPWWFARDDVFLNPDHVPYLHQLFEPVHFAERRGPIGSLPLAKAPYYLFVGRK